MIDENTVDTRTENEKWGALCFLVIEKKKE